MHERVHRKAKGISMKKFLPLLIVVVLLVSVIGITSAFAGVSISGNSIIQAGKTYKYTIRVSGNASSIGGTVSCGGVFSGANATFWKDSASGENANITASTSITVKVASGAALGEKGTITVSGEGSTFDGENVGSFNISGSKSATIGVPPTRDPNAPLVGWEIVEVACDEAAVGTPVNVEVPAKYKKIPESILETLIANKTVLTIDYGTYKCTIDPAKLTDIKGIKSLDLDLSLEKAEGMSEELGGIDLYQLHFGHSGQFPGMITFSFEASENEPGDTVYLYYYYDEANMLEGKAEAVVDDKGIVTFDIYHCSSYVVTGAVVPGAMRNFDNETADALEAALVTVDETQTALNDSQAEYGDSQTALGESQSRVADLEAELVDAQDDLDDAEDDLDDEKDALKKLGASSVSWVVFIIVLAGALLIGVLLTMLLTKSGLFKRLAKK